MNAIDPPWTTLVDAASLAAALAAAAPRLLDARATASIAPRLVDARFALADPQSGAAQYAAGHLPGAVYADLNRDLSDLSRQGHGRHPLPDSDAFAATLGRWGIGPDTQVVVYDAGDGSMAAARLWWLLRLIGHRRVAVLDGGLAAWQAAAQPVVADPPQVQALPPYPGRFDLAQVADADEIAARLGQAPGWLIDARAGERYRGDVEPLDRVAGHVPGALNRPFALNLREGRFRPAAELRAELQPLLGAHAPGEAVVMCGSGVTACHLLLAFEVAGLGGVRVFADSWSGWSSDPARPVERS
ncbi:MAG: sulfurtransferase [Lysobacteraceae bacterium SCN 69-123]|jgi:thiosulfate/3-mercaptopyruvate sulfurtransferase|uniref:sulfurtransferase n=1 Tax=Stenotrophomonas acidaminiphila TaxID=128780 RepID=UPI00086862B6|nr:sulfurtransferase [Stenotrophomonas acidaminiphila]MDF9441106.1 sulfurtransferase [Stenotrophomonas acidaminiphila]ODU45658.1 MAG: sulfurtransferase [Xanthomonadaceae bacterium SCN 69-123]OJY76447.1 MAG: sulfurtransferase [Stenotrophomonas sp. 69-14]